jgi:hypothetical protein
MKFRVSLKTESVLSISKSRATGNDLETLRHIPGGVWRGAVAAALIREKRLGGQAHEDADFRALFLDKSVRFGDLRIEGDSP